MGGQEVVQDPVPTVELFPNVRNDSKPGDKPGEEDPVERRRRNIYSKLELSDLVHK